MIKQKILSILTSGFLIIISWGLLFLLFKGCSALVQPSEEHRLKVKFLNEVLTASDQTINEAISHCATENSSLYRLSDTTSVTCEEIRKRVYEYSLNRSRNDAYVNELVRRSEYDWMKQIMSFRSNITADKLDDSIKLVKQNMHHCVAANITMTGKPMSKKLVKSCAGLVPICVDLALKETPSEGIIFCNQLTQGLTKFLLDD